MQQMQYFVIQVNSIGYQSKKTVFESLVQQLEKKTRKFGTSTAHGLLPVSVVTGMVVTP